MRVGVLFSGGKDSCLALHKILKEGHEVRFLLSIDPANKDSFMFHKPSIDLLKKQADELGISILIQKSEGEKEKELADLELLIQKVHIKVDGIVVGGIASNYQGERIKKLCEKYSIEFLAPLWGCTAEELWEELLEEGFKVILTKISCEGIDKKLIGKIIDKESLEELKKLSEKYKFRLDFEGGEAETAVLFMPEFKREIKIEFETESSDRYRHFLKIKSIR